jgi:Flp pilus assembly pilin Flp
MVGRFLRDEAGTSAAEYALLLMIFCAAVLMGAYVLSTSIGGGIGRFANALDAPSPANGGDPETSNGGDSEGSGPTGDGSSGGTSGKSPPPGCGHGHASDHNPNCRP